jgi:hypothetical protein
MRRVPLGRAPSSFFKRRIIVLPGHDAMIEAYEGKPNSFAAVILLIAMFAAAAGIALLIASVILTPAPAGFVMLPPRARAWLLGHSYARLLLALSLIPTGIALHAFRRGWPQLYALIEFLFGTTLAWIAFGNVQADRLTATVAILGASYVIVRALNLLADTWPKASPEQTEVLVTNTAIQIRKGDELLAEIPKDLSGIVYKINLDQALDRITRLEAGTQGQL